MAINMGIFRIFLTNGTSRTSHKRLATSLRGVDTGNVRPAALSRNIVADCTTGTAGIRARVTCRMQILPGTGR